jgi:hypothetical protein
MFDETDPVYKIIVGMAENLVPDVCAVIMGFLADIHIELGRLRWLQRVKEVNREYMDEVFISSAEILILIWNNFTFNWRSVECEHEEESQIFNVRTFLTGKELSKNYIHAVLYA